MPTTKSEHSEHCKARLQWGDGECECGANDIDRADILVAIGRLLGPGAYRLQPFKPFWARWGAPRSTPDAELTSEVNLVLRSLSRAQVDTLRRYLGSRPGRYQTTTELRCYAWRVYDGENCIAVAWIDPHTLLPTIQPTWSTPAKKEGR